LLQLAIMLSHSGLRWSFLVAIRAKPPLSRCASTISTSGTRTEDPKIVKDPPQSTSLTLSGRIEKISNAMKQYLERAQKQEAFIKEKKDEFELGKRHLANIMGWDPNHITQDDIDSAIRYLLPSGLFEPKARPMMKPPEEVYPKHKVAMFDVQGRPFSPFFYAVKATYYEYLHDIHAVYLSLNNFEDQMISKGILIPPKEGLVDLTGTEWMTLGEVRKQMMENITDEEYQYMIQTLERLASHPYSARIKDLFLRYRKKMVSVTEQMDVPPLTVDEKTGRPYAEAEGLRKHCSAKVRVWGNGTGKVKINGHDLSYFDFFIDREQVMFPLQFTGMLFKVDFEATVTANNKMARAAEAGAIRHGLSLALRSFVDAEMVESMRLAGLLTKDRRVCERKKPGQWAARRKFTWRKR